MTRVLETSIEYKVPELNSNLTSTTADYSIKVQLFATPRVSSNVIFSPTLTELAMSAVSWQKESSEWQKDFDADSEVWPEY